jgi:hypothetical protein
MKTNRFKNLAAATFCLVAFSTAGCTEKDKTSNVPMPSEKNMTTTTVKEEPTTTAQMTATTSPDVASAKWIEIKDCTYDSRASFFTGLKQLEARVDGQVNELTAKRAAMKSDANTKDWDFAMKEMLDARSYLKSVGVELSKASAETWNQQKDTVGQAWVRTQDAYKKVKSSMTI